MFSERMARVCGGLENGAFGEKARILGMQSFCSEWRRLFDAGSILSRAWNSAVAFFKLWRSVSVYSIECPRLVPLVRLDLQRV
jgi:hypothetical protein